MTQNQQVPKAFETLPLLEQEWHQNPTATREKFLQFIEYHENVNQKTTACLYRCALVQLQQGGGVQQLSGLGMNDVQLKAVVGV